MARITLSPTRATYVYSEAPTQSYGNLSRIYSDKTTVTNAQTGEKRTKMYVAIVQFTIPAAALAGTITSANLSYSYEVKDKSNFDTQPWIPAVRSAYTISPYVGDNTSYALTYNNYKSINTENPASVSYSRAGWTSDTYPNANPYHEGSTVSDVVGIVVNNLTNGVIGFIINDYGISTLALSNLSLVIDYTEPQAIDPSIIYPNKIYIKEGNQVTLSWAYNANGSATLVKSELQWQKEGDSWNSVTINGTGISYTIPEILAQGVYNWRVRTTDSNGSVTNYVDASFTIIGKPAAPVVTNVVNSALTTISWNASEQFAYRLSLEKDGVVLDQKEASDDVKSYKPNFYLQNGTYSFKLAVSNTQGEWSAESIKTFTINATSPAKGSIVIRMEDNKVILNLSAPGTIIRNGEVLAVVDGTEYIDNTCVSNVEYAYQLRLCEGAGYSDSDKAYSLIKYTGFILEGNAGVVHCKVSDQTFLSLAEAFTQSKALIDYVGRELPVVEVGEQGRKTLTRTAIVTSEELERLRKLYKESKIFYRDTEGQGYYVTITNLSATKWRDVGYSVQIVMTGVHTDEVIVNA